MLNRHWPHGLSMWNWVRDAGEGPSRGLLRDYEPSYWAFLKHCVSAAGLNPSCGCLMSLGKAEMRLRWWHKNLNYAPAAGEYWQRCNVTWPHWPGPHTTAPHSQDRQNIILIMLLLFFSLHRSFSWLGCHAMVWQCDNIYSLHYPHITILDM